jgi:hypothetical protein
MKKIASVSFLFIAYIFGNLVYAQGVRSTKAGIPLHKVVRNVGQLNRTNQVSMEKIVSEKNVPGFTTVKKDDNVQFYEISGYLIEIGSQDVILMKKGGYFGIAKFYKVSRAEFSEDELEIEYNQSDGQSYMIKHFKGSDSYTFVVESSKYNLMGTIYRQKNSEEAANKFVKNFVKDLRLKE